MCCQCIKNHIIMHTKIFKKYKKVDFYGKITVFETLTLAAHISVFIFFNSTDAKNPFPTLPFNIYIYIYMYLVHFTNLQVLFLQRFSHLAFYISLWYLPLLLYVVVLYHLPLLLQLHFSSHLLRLLLQFYFQLIEHV